MNNSMNILKRMMAFLLAMLLLTTMMGDDFSSLADSDVDIVTETITDDGAASDVETTEGETADTTTPEPEVTEEVTEPVETEPEVTDPEVTDPEVTEDVTNPEEINIDDSQNINETEEIVPEEEVPEEDAEEECEHDWKAVSNNDGTHTWVCTKCEDRGETEDCEFGEDGICIHCGYEQPAEEEECDHEWEYTSNEDGTHTKHCTKCDEEEIEDCEFDEDWVCVHCEYEDMSLVQQEYSKTIHGVKVTVSGMMPRNSKITVYTKSLTRMSEIVNENVDEEGTFEAYEAFDINIYDRHGDKYQPKDDGNSVSVTFEGVSELADTPDEEIVAYRIEDDQSTVTEVPTDVSGEDVTIDAEHFSIYVVGTHNSNLYASYQSYQNFATILTAPTTKAYTRVKKVRFDMYVDSIEEFNFTATVYKDLTSTTNPTSGTPVATKTDKETPTSTGWMTVELTLPTSTSGYIQAGEKFSIVVSSTNDLVNIGYGTQKDSTYSAPTYVKGTSSWSRKSAEDEIFYIIEGDTIELTDVTEDTYTIDSITASTGKADSQKIYHYAVGDTDTLSAIIKDVDGNTVSRTVSWKSDNENVVKVDSSGKLTAVGTGTTTVRASYTNSTTTNTKDITVNVISVSLASTTFTYTGLQIEPKVTVSGGDSSATIDTSYSNNTDASTSTSKGQAVTTYTINGQTYTFTNEFTISPATLTGAAFASADLVVTDGEVTSITGTTAIVDSGDAPVYNKDFTATTSAPSTSSGITYEVAITGQGNYTGSFTWTKTLTGVDVSTLLTAKLTSKGINLKDTYYTGIAKALTTDSGVWQEVAFYDSDGVQNKTIINEGTATYVITDKGGTDSSPITAGTKTITFTMKEDSGYTGSISVDFTIQKANMNSTTIKWKHGGVENNYSFDHTGSAIEPVAGTDFDVYIGDVLLTAPNDSNSDAEYKVSYVGDHTAVTDTPYVRVTGAGINFDATTYQQSSYVIIPCYANDLVVRISDGTNYDGTVSNGYKTGYSTYYNPAETSKYFETTDANYNENENSPNIKVLLPGATLTEKIDYKVEVFNDFACTQKLTNDVTSGTTKYIKVTGLGTYATQKTVVATYTVDKLPLSNVTVTTKSNITKTFTGKEIKLTPATASTTATADITVKYGSTILTYGTDYTIEYSDNVNAGTATYKIVGLNNYTGELTSSTKYKFTINKASIASGNSDGVTVGLVNEQTFKYDGKVKKPAVKVVITTNGTTTFEESIDPTTNTTLSTDNFTVSYENDPSPGTHLITLSATSTGNLKDSVTIPITIGSNTSSFDIWVTGDNGQNQAQRLSTLDQTTEETAEDGSTYTVYKRYYYLDNNFKTYYTGKKVACGFSVYDSEGTLLEKGSDYSSFYSGTAIKAYVQSGDYTTSTSSPYLSITGLGSYENNNAIVYFNIQPRNIDEAKVEGIADNYPWEKDVTKTPDAPVLTFNGNTLTEDDYTVEYYDTYDPEDSTKNVAITAKAGTKYAVFTAKSGGNYTGTKVVTYTVGTSLEKLKVSISSATNDNTTADDGTLVNNLIWVNQEDVSAKTYNIDWMCAVDSDGKSYGAAPVITLFDSTGTAIDPNKYSVTESSSKYGTDNTKKEFYNSREGDETDYNVITYTATPKYEEGYYGEPVVIKYRINPQPFAGGRVMQNAEKLNDQQPYTGADITVNPAYVFTYKYQLKDTPLSTIKDGYSCELVAGTDFKPASLEIGKNVGDNKSVTVQGTGNFIGDRNIPISIVQGDVRVWAVYNGKEEEITSKLVEDTTTTETDDYIVDLGGIYTYKEGENQCPEIYVTPTALEGKDNALGTADCVIAYPADQTSADGNDKLITVDVNKNGNTSSNFKTKKITVKYKIKTNEITGFYGTMSDVTYTQTTLDLNAINTLINTNKVAVHLYETKGGKELTRGTDYEIIGVETTSLPSYQTSYLTVKGLNTYSGTEKIYFNIVLDLTSTTGSNSLASVSFASSRNLLVNEDTIVPTIKYKTLNSTEYDGTIPTTISIDGKDEPTYSIARTNPGEPGEDPAVSVTGQYLCVNTAAHVLAADGSEIYFLADLATYSGISLKTTTIEYTGSVLDPTTLFNGLLGNAGSADTNGDYTISYNYKKTSSATETSHPSDAKEVGVYNVVVTATDNSKYYAKDSNTGTRFTFYIKYNLTNATIKIYDEANNEITETSYTGSAFSIVDHVKVFVKDTSEASKTRVIYHKASSLDSNAYISVTPATVTNIDTYTIKAQKATGYDDVVYGEKSVTFDVSGVSLKTKGTFTITTPDDGFVYTGSGIEPKVTGTVKVGETGTPKTLTEGKDFSVTYYNNTNATNGGDKAYIGITGLGSYKCPTFYPDSLKFEIEKLDLSDTDHVVVEVEDATYSGYFLDPTTGGDKVKLTPDYAVYYVDKANGIKNKLQVQTGTTSTGDYYAPGVVDGSFYSNNTVAANSTDTNAPKLTVTAGASGNTKNSASGTFNIKKLDLNSGSVSFAQNTAEYTGGEIDVANIVKMTTSYTDASGKVVTVPLTQKGAYQAVDDTKCDYSVTIKKGNTNITNGKVTEVGTYTIEISGLNSCESSITDTFTVTERSLSSNYHYYYSAGNGFQGTWTYKSDLDTNTTTAEPGYITTGGLKDSAGNITDTLTIMVYDVVTKDANGGDNVPKIAITDVYKGAGTNGADVTYELVENKDFTLSVKNAKDTGSAEWSATVTDDKHAPVASTSPKVIITGTGTYTGTLELPFNIGKNLNNLGITVTYRYGSNTYEYNTSENNSEKFKDQWTYDYDSKAHKPVVVSVGSISAKNYTVTYTDESGNTDACINAGYKKVVITGEGDYCGTITQTYKVNKRKISDSTTSLFETQNPMQSSDGMLQFTISGTNLSRMTAADVQTYLVDTGKIKTTDTDNQTKFVGYYYTTYDGATVKPTVKIEDLGLNTVVDNTKDVKITYEPDCGTASTFIYEGSTLKYTTSTINIEFRTDNDAENIGNYYAPTNPITFTIKFIILEDALNDFDVKFVNGTDDNMYDYADGDEIKPEVTVFNTKRELELGTDYTLKYDDNVMPGKATVTVTGIGNYSGDKSLNFYITGDLSKTSVYYYDENKNFVKAGDDIGPVQTYHGEGITKGDPQMYLVLERDGGNPEDEKLTYDIEYSCVKSDSDTRTGEVTYRGITDASKDIYWSGDKTVTFNVDFDISNIGITNYKSEYQYTGYPIIPDFKLDYSESVASITSIEYKRDGKTITYTGDGETVTEAPDFVEPGTIEATINYEVNGEAGSKTIKYKITPRNVSVAESDTSYCTVVLASEQRYTGLSVIPSYTIFITSYNLQTDKKQIFKKLVEYNSETGVGDYEISYPNKVYSTSNEDCTFTLTGKGGRLTGTYTKNYTIKLQSVANLVVTSKTSESISVEWVRDIFSDGTTLTLEKINSSGDYEVIKIAGAAKSTTYTFTGLTGSTTYRVSATAYANAPDGTTLHSEAETVETTTDISTSSFDANSYETGNATLTWSTTGNVTIYYIYRAEDETSEGKLVAILPASTGAYTNTKLTSGQTYYYHIDGYGRVNGKRQKITESEHKPVTIK